MPLTYRRQPAVAYLIRDGWTRPSLAAEIIRRGGSCTVQHLFSVLRGTAHPSRDVREHLPAIFGAPLDALFEPRLLDKSYSGPRHERAEAHR